jgi:hypothetical protein
MDDVFSYSLQFLSSITLSKLLVLNKDINKKCKTLLQEKCRIHNTNFSIKINHLNVITYIIESEIRVIGIYAYIGWKYNFFSLALGFYINHSIIVVSKIEIKEYIKVASELGLYNKDPKLSLIIVLSNNNHKNYDFKNKKKFMLLTANENIATKKMYKMIPNWNGLIITRNHEPKSRPVKTVIISFNPLPYHTLKLKPYRCISDWI